jgi:DNA-binding SARP family transcriptional activator
MTCYAEKGDKKKVITHLHELQELLQEELALEPSTETIALVQNLLN